MMNRSLVLLALTVLVAVACTREAAAPPAKTTSAKPTSTAPADLSTAKIEKQLIPDAALNFIEGSMLGSLLDRDGNVLGDKNTFKRGDRVALTMRFRESPTGLRAIAVFSDLNGKDIETLQNDMQGAKVATFIMTKRLPPGRYKVTGYWGGNVAVEREFQVTK